MVEHGFCVFNILKDTQNSRCIIETSFLAALANYFCLKITNVFLAFLNFATLCVMKISRKVFDLFLSYILDANEIETVSSYYFEFGVSSFLQTLQKFQSRHSKHALCQKTRESECIR